MKSNADCLCPEKDYKWKELHQMFAKTEPEVGWESLRGSDVVILVCVCVKHTSPGCGKPWEPWCS